MHDNSTLGHVTLKDSLNAAYRALAEAFDGGSRVLCIGVPGLLTSGVVEDDLPGRVFHLAVDARWIAKPHELPEGDPEEDEMVGNLSVGKAYREWFMAFLADSLSHYREIAAKNDADANLQKLHSELFSSMLLVVGKYALDLEHAKKGTTAPPLIEANNPIAPEWAESYKQSRVPETSPDERKALEQRYLSTNLHPGYGDEYELQELQWLANTNPKVWQRWRRGETNNNSRPGKRILDLLERNKPTKNLKYLPERNREKLEI